MGKAVDDDLSERLHRDFRRFDSFKTNYFSSPADIVGHIFDSFIDAFKYISPELLQITKANSFIRRICREFQ